MTVRYPILRSVVLDATDARELAEFYRALLGFEYRPGDEAPSSGLPDPAGNDFLILIDPETRTQLSFQHVDQQDAPTWPRPDVPQQLHLDLSVASTAELTEQVERAVILGAKILLDRADDAGEPLFVFSDPAGHPFCIFVGPGPSTKPNDFPSEEAK
jgi:catechol 2,3-dioxygenase-like lactoylglutathione lyase family enzyme